MVIANFSSFPRGVNCCPRAGKRKAAVLMYAYIYFSRPASKQTHFGAQFPPSSCALSTYEYKTPLTSSPELLTAKANFPACILPLLSFAPLHSLEPVLRGPAKREGWNCLVPKRFSPGGPPGDLWQKSWRISSRLR